MQATTTRGRVEALVKEWKLNLRRVKERDLISLANVVGRHPETVLAILADLYGGPILLEDAAGHAHRSATTPVENRRQARHGTNPRPWG